ncbi:MAG: ParB N-terminal domain-containing protein, partial [Acidimicrobiales bacterium]
MIIPIDQITVDRKRFREATGDMEGLAQSILTFGQLVPIILDDKHELLDGFRRYSACKMNGATEVEVILRQDVSELLAREIELEANLQRQDMSWQETQLALATLDKLRRDRDPNWTQVKTAQLAGVRGQNAVSEAVTLSNAMALFPELKEAKNKAQAMTWLKTKVKQVARVVEVRDGPVDYSDIESKIILGDSVEIIKGVPDSVFHAIITDPPFGVDYGDRVAGTEGSLNSYKDDADSYRHLLSMAPDLYRTLKPNGWLVWFFGMSWYREVVDAFGAAGFT